MSTARFTILDINGKGTKDGSLATSNARKGVPLHVVARGDFGAFNASTNPEGIQGLTTTDTIVIGVVGDDGAVPSRRKTVAKLLLESVALYTDTALTLGTANNILLKVIRGSASVLPAVTLKTITEASFAANALITTGEVNIIVEEGDSIVLVPDGAMDGSAAATADIYAELCLKRIVEGGLISQGTAVA
jgi:hypothetical protein